MKKLFLNLISFLVIFTALACGGRDETDLVIFFDLLDGGSHYICSIDEDGQNFKKIAGPFLANTYPASSSDGTRIVFSKRVTIGPDNLAQIWTMNTDGTGMKQETSPAIYLHHIYPTWSIDSRYIYYVQWDDIAGNNYSALYRLDIETGQITSDGSHSYSNNNAVACFDNYIAYYDFGTNWTNVMNMNTYADTFTSGISGLYYPTFLYDGRLLASQSNMIYIFQSDFSSYSTIDFSAQGLTPIYPAVSPDGSKIVFVDSGSGSLWIYNIKGGGNALLLKTGMCNTPNYIAKPR